MVEYDRDTQSKAAKEVDSGSCPVLNGFTADYSVLRDQARVK